MSRPVTTERATPRPAQQEPTDERTLRLVGKHRTSTDIQAALKAIPADSVTARTAGALREVGPRRAISEERAAFERGVAEENAGSSER